VEDLWFPHGEHCRYPRSPAVSPSLPFPPNFLHHRALKMFVPRLTRFVLTLFPTFFFIVRPFFPKWAIGFTLHKRRWNFGFPPSPAKGDINFPEAATGFEEFFYAWLWCSFRSVSPPCDFSTPSLAHQRFQGPRQFFGTSPSPSLFFQAVLIVFVFPVFVFFLSSDSHFLMDHSRFPYPGTSFPTRFCSF